jgi:large subunit ribosomal protein L6
MSRIGRMPIAIPAGVTVTIAEKNVVSVKGPKGELVRELPVEMEIKEEEGKIIVTRPNDLKRMKSLHGLTRTLIANMITGVTAGYEKKLEINGVGYRASKQGSNLVMNLGYSHQVIIPEVDGITIEVPGPNEVIVKGPDKQQVGQFAAEIRSKRPPEPYKGKGVKYAGEYIRRKEGKAGKGSKK